MNDYEARCAAWRQDMDAREVAEELEHRAFEVWWDAFKIMLAHHTLSVTDAKGAVKQLSVAEMADFAEREWRARLARCRTAVAAIWKDAPTAPEP